jgi:hypothetical protein
MKLWTMLKSSIDWLPKLISILKNFKNTQAKVAEFKSSLKGDLDAVKQTLQQEEEYKRQIGTLQEKWVRVNKETPLDTQRLIGEMEEIIKKFESCETFNSAFSPEIQPYNLSSSIDSNIKNYFLKRDQSIKSICQQPGSLSNLEELKKLCRNLRFYDREDGVLYDNKKLFENYCKIFEGKLNEIQNFQSRRKDELNKIKELIEKSIDMLKDHENKPWWKKSFFSFWVMLT